MKVTSLSNSDLLRIMQLPVERAKELPGEPYYDCAFDDPTGTYWYICDVAREATHRGLEIPPLVKRLSLSPA